MVVSCACVTCLQCASVVTNRCFSKPRTHESRAAMVRNQSNFLGETNMCDRPSSKRESAAAILAKATVSWNAAGVCIETCYNNPFSLACPTISFSDALFRVQSYTCHVPRALCNTRGNSLWFCITTLHMSTALLLYRGNMLPRSRSSILS